MKIGSIDLSWRAAALVVAIAVAIGVDVKLFLSGSAKRAEGFLGEKAWRASLAGTPKGMDEAAEYAGELLASCPDKFDVHWLYAGALLGAGKHSEAEEAYRKILSLPKLTPRQKALAWVGRGGAAFLGATGGKIEKAAKLARESFEKALAEDSSCIEAKTNLGLLLLRGESQEDAEKAARLLEEVAEGKLLPGREGTLQLYNGLGVAMARVGKVAEADRYLKMAMEANPKWQEPAENRKVVVVASLPDPSLDDSTRVEILERLERKWPRFGAYEVRAMNAAGLGWHLRRSTIGADEYAASAAPRAIKYFSKACEMKPGDYESAMNLVGVYEQLLADAFEQYKISAPDMGPDREVESPFGKAAKTDGGAQQVPDAKAIAKIGSLLTQLESQCSKLLRTKDADKKLRVELSLRIALCHRWRAALGISPKAQSLEAALSALQEALSAVPGDARLLRASAHVRSVLGKYAEAADDLRKYREAGFVQGEDPKTIEVMLETLSRPPDIVWLRPSGGRWFGARPVVSASLAVRSCPLTPRQSDVTVSLNGAAVAHKLVGTEAIYLPGPDDLKGGATIKFQARDAMGNAVERQVTISPDEEPPVLSCEPADGALVDGPRPQFEFSIKDAKSGVDFKSVNLKLTSAPGGPTVNLAVIVAGKQKFKFDETGTEILMSEKFKIRPPVDLAPGEYKWTLQASDASGNSSSLTVNFRVR
jgi:tetratricopeptide (TPR) repeat protein